MKSIFTCWAKPLGFVAFLLAAGVASPALAVCSAANQYSFNFSSLAATGLAYGSNYNYTATSTALGSQNFNVAFFQNGVSSTTVGGQVRPNISNSHNGGGTGTALVVGGILSARTADAATDTRVMRTTFTFASPVRDITIQMHDIDFTTNQFRDWINITGTNGASSYVPALTGQAGQVNVTGPFTNAASSMKLGPTAAPLATAVQQSVGTGDSGNNSATGNLRLVFPQPVTSVVIRYGNYPLQTGETTTGQQAFAISTVSWCPMPSLTVLKSSAPMSVAAADPNRLNIPGSDTIYSLTVTNSNSSPVDLNAAILADILPPRMTFYNGDIDGAGPLTTNFEFVPGTSGLTMAPANIAYSNTGGATYAYSPAAGYDAAMNAIRFNPQGSMAANSTFTIKFRTRIK